MPIFEYRCKRCGHVTAFLEKPDSGGRHRCEKCGSTATEKLLSAFAAHSANPAAKSARPGSDSCPTGTCPLTRP